MVLRKYYDHEKELCNNYITHNQIYNTNNTCIKYYRDNYINDIMKDVIKNDNKEAFDIYIAKLDLLNYYELIKEYKPKYILKYYS